MVSLTFLSVFWAVITLALCVVRAVGRLLITHVVTRRLELRYILILGTNPRAIEFADRSILANHSST